MAGAHEDLSEVEFLLCCIALILLLALYAAYLFELVLAAAK